MNEDVFSAKLSAFLHDPIDKPFILMQGESHEERAKKLADKLAVSLNYESASDYIASAMERAFLPKNASKTEKLQVKFLNDPYITHPFTGASLEKIKNLKGKKKEEFKKVVDTFFEETSKISFNSDKEKFIYLWRNFLPRLEKLSSDEIKKFWSLIPADTRIPDHSIFEHLKITSACYQATKEQRLLLNGCSLFFFTIGPVQSFISQARKTQDLYWGSFILSYLNWKGIEYIIDQYGSDSIIFPELLYQPLVDSWIEKELKIKIENSFSEQINMPTIPNCFLAILPISEEKKLKDIGEKVESKVKEEIEKISNKILETLKIKKPENFNKQINDFFKLYWVALPWFQDTGNQQDWEYALTQLKPYLNPDFSDYYSEYLDYFKKNTEYRLNIGNVYSLLFSFLKVTLKLRKNIGEFEQLEEEGRKCSLCGERNVLFYKDENRNRTKYSREAIFLENIPSGYLSNGEGLCGLCFMKRGAEEYFKDLFPRNFSDFPSTAEIAQGKFIEEFLKKLKAEDFKEFREYFHQGFDPQLLYEENLTDQYFKRYQISAPLDKVKPLQKKLIATAKEKKFKQSKYYAILMLDGDNMGQWLSGKNAPYFEKIYHPEVWKNLSEEFRSQLQNKKRPVTPALHSAISSALRNYSLEFVKKIFEQNKYSKLIYCGGDDVLAFICLEELLDVMVKLRGAFSGHIDKNLDVNFLEKSSGFVEDNHHFLLTLGSEATASAGICIAHYKTPLNEVLQSVREMEKKAKQWDCNKNRFAIALLKHSGSRTETNFCWTLEDSKEKEGTIAVLKKLIRSLQNEEISDSFLYDLRQEFSKFLDFDNNNSNENIPDDMILSELRRLICRSSQNDGYLKVEQSGLINDLGVLYREARNFKNFLAFLEIAIFLKRETTL
jgi:CRISPR-associated protein Cmr2